MEKIRNSFLFASEMPVLILRLPTVRVCGARRGEGHLARVRGEGKRACEGMQEERAEKGSLVERVDKHCWSYEEQK